MPGPSTTTWERSAIAVKNTNVTNPYLEAIRDTHDPTMHLKTIEDELKGTIGKALGKQGDKILTALQRMQEEFQNYQELLAMHETVHHPAVQACAVRFNNVRKQAIQARWELMVHRQAAGFIVNNHKYVMEHYPIAQALPVCNDDDDDDDDDDDNDINQPAASLPKKKQFGDQLDWWQRIGRWR